MQVFLHTDSILEELGVTSGSNINSIYKAQEVGVDEIMRGTTVLKNSFNISLQQEQRTLPQIYWTPKLHKTPYKARFIAGSSSCTTNKHSN